MSGQLRRAIVESPLRLSDLAEHARVPVETLADFLAGDAVLDSDALSRIADVLDYHLTSRN